MISSAFKSAYLNEQSAINQTASNVTGGIKDAGTLVAGIAGFSGALGSGAVATAAKHNLAGRIGGIGGNIMLATMDEKKAVAQSQQIQNLAKLSEEELDARFKPIVKVTDPNSLEEQVVDTVWNKIQKERAKNLEKNLINKLDLQQFASKNNDLENYYNQLDASLNHYQNLLDNIDKEIEKAPNKNLKRNLENNKISYPKIIEEISKRKDMINKFKDIAKKENLEISSSPYSDSFYAHKKGEVIDWGEKPEGSYRLADHWNWTDKVDKSKIHCPTSDGNNYGLSICQQRQGKYHRLEDDE